MQNSQLGAGASTPVPLSLICLSDALLSGCLLRCWFEGSVCAPAKRSFVLQVNAPFDLSGRTRILPHAEPEADVDMTESIEPKEKRPRITVTLPGGRSTPQVGDVPSWV